MNTTLIRKDIEDKSIVWFSETNQYIVLENKTAEIVNLLHSEIPTQEISKQLMNELNIPSEQAELFVSQIQREILIPNTTKKDTDLTNSPKYTIPNFNISKFYKIEGLIFKVDYQSEFEEYLIHPKFSHLETDVTSNYDHNFQVFTNNDKTFLIINNNFIGSWLRKNIHYFQGKFSMYIVQYIHNKPEDNWMGIFHASGLGNTKKSLLLLGDSGNGKSTSLAILQANGFTCLADDFVPVDIEKQHVYTFPSAISIKKNSLETLLPMYPELEHTAEFNFKRLNKIVRYLPPNTTKAVKHLPCNDLIFIKYEKNSELIFNSISNITAFQQLIPDSWISNTPENVHVFLDWFSRVNCYQLTYSNNTKMVETIKNILNNDI